MKTTFIVLIVGILALPLLGAPADPSSEVDTAIRKLAEASSYSWVSTPRTEGSKSGSKQGPVEGKTEKSGLTHVKTSAGDNAYELAYQGDKFVVKLSDDWIAPSELPIDDGRLEKRLKTFKTPAKEAAELLAKVKDLKREGDAAFTGSLAPELAKSLFGQLGKRAAEAPEAKGTVTFWVKDSRLIKYELKVRGSITAGTDKQEVNISRTTTVEIKDVDHTTISLPEAARGRLS